MNILVIGCDQVGASLIRDLERIGHDISLIEKDPEQLKRLDAFDDYSFGGTALVGDPTDPDVLRRGGVERMEQLCAIQRAGPEKLLEIRSIGAKSLPLIAAVCARYEENKTPSQGGAPLRETGSCLTQECPTALRRKEDWNKNGSGHWRCSCQWP